MERLLTTEEVAELLRIDAVTVRRLIMRGELTAYRIAGEFRFTPADLEKFLESQRVVVNIASKNQFGDKFTDQARKVLSLAIEEARRYHHNGVGTEHVLLAIMSEGEGIAVKALGARAVGVSGLGPARAIVVPSESARAVIGALPASEGTDRTVRCRGSFKSPQSPCRRFFLLLR